MITLFNTRNQTVVFYEELDKSRTQIKYLDGFFPDMQFIFDSQTSVGIEIYDSMNDQLLGSETVTPVVEDIDNDLNDEYIYTFSLNRQDYSVPGSSDYVYFKLTIDSEEYYSAVFCITTEAWQLLWKNSCDIEQGYYSGGFENEFIFNSLQAETEYETVIDVAENGAGEEFVTRRYQRKRYRIQFYGHRDRMDALQSLKYHDQIEINGLNNSYDIENVQIEFGAEDNDFGIYTLSYNIVDERINVLSCCEGDFTISGEDPEGGDDDPCDSAALNFNFNDPTLSVVTNGFPSGSNFQYEWFRVVGNGTVDLGGGQSITLNNYGIYRVIVNGGGCTKVAEFNFNDPCEGFGFSFNVNGSSIVANPFSGINPTYEWKYVDDQNNETVLNDTNNEIVAQNSGTYVLTISENGCSFTDSVQIDLSECDITVSIEENNEVLSAVHDCENGASFNWFLKQNEDDGFIGFGNNTKSQIIDLDGVYKVEVTCDGCTESAYYLVNRCDPECQLSVVVEELNNGDLNAVITGCSEIANVVWFVNSGNGFVQYDVGQTITPEVNGVYRVYVKCGEECEKFADKMVYDCDECNLIADVVQNGMQMEVNITNCDGNATINWFIDKGNGRMPLGETGQTVDITDPGIYIAEVLCDGCYAEDGELYCPEGGGEINVNYGELCV